ncbi:MAG: hypothetical protein ABJE47_08370 [bacterium]
MRCRQFVVFSLASVAGMSVSGCLASTAKPAPSAVANPSMITETELSSASSEGNAYDLIRRLRPAWFASRGAVTLSNRPATSGIMHISLDGAALQDVELLTRMRSTELKEVHFLSATDAAQRFGATASSGTVLLIVQQ